MAVFRNVMAFLGLDDDDQMYDDETYYDEEDERSLRGRNKNIALDDRLPDHQTSFGFSADSEMNEMGGVGAVRPLRPVEQDGLAVPDALAGLSPTAGVDHRVREPGSGVALESAIPADNHGAETGVTVSQTSPMPASSAPSEVPVATATVSVIDGASRQSSSPSTEEPQFNVVTHAKPRLHIPSSFEDASRIADDFRAGAPVVMNLTAVDKPVARRLVDFASGVCYVLAGGMERVAANVYLLTPAGVGVSDEDRRRMQERGFER
jgi:cell division inhibitor SepF